MNTIETVIKQNQKIMENIVSAAEKEGRDLTADETLAFRAAEDAAENAKQTMNQPKRSIPISGRFTTEGGDGKPFTSRVMGKVGARFEELFEVRSSGRDVNAELINFYERRTIVSGSGVAGGFTVPVELERDVYNLVLPRSIFLGRMTVFPMKTGTLLIPKLDSFDQTLGFIGAVNSQWAAEGGTFTPVTPTFEEQSLIAKKNGIYMNASPECLADSGGRMDALIGQMMALAVQQSIDYEILTGNGVARPLGIYESPATISVTRNTPDDVKYSDLVSMMTRVHPIFLPGAIWVVSPAAMEKLMLMQDATGALIWNVNGTAGADAAVPERLLGKPLFVNDKCSDLGTAGDVVLVAPQAIAFGLRQGVQLESSSSPEWYSHLISFRAIMRCDASPLLSKPIKPKNGGPTLSFAAMLE